MHIKVPLSIQPELNYFRQGDKSHSVFLEFEYNDLGISNAKLNNSIIPDYLAWDLLGGRSENNLRWLNNRLSDDDDQAYD